MEFFKSKRMKLGESIILAEIESTRVNWIRRYLDFEVKKLREFNINDYIYIQITDLGWQHLFKTVGSEYIENCIKSREEVIDGISYYRLQCYEAFNIMPQSIGFNVLFKPSVLIECNNNDESFIRKYWELYCNVADMLVKNLANNWSARELLKKWDKFRESPFK